jgi:hypothetical protein
MLKLVISGTMTNIFHTHLDFYILRDNKTKEMMFR